VSNASPVEANVSMTYAYDNQFIALNMSALFGLPHTDNAKAFLPLSELSW
jgi:hypothetical protein